MMINVIISQIIFWVGLAIVALAALLWHFGRRGNKQKQLATVALVLAACYAVGMLAIFVTGFHLPQGKVEHYEMEDGYYTGELKKGKPEGLGSLTLPNGMILRCVFKNGKSNSSGQLTLVDGSVYNGEIQNLQMHGFGALVRHVKDGDVIYTGNFDRGLFTGEGSIQYPNGDFYQGQVVNFRPSGTGTLTMADGSVYQGNFADGLFHNMGSFTCKTCGHVYEGEWRCGLMSGQGSLTLKDERVFAGNWLSDSFQKELFYCDNPYYANNKLLAGGKVFGQAQSSFKEEADA